ncbi:hypothetical protein DH2020_005558 [Rehmannia glutinosa]|uniref:GMP synthase (glutamine-hydrolyzing) n=1 Tax=Rehmannia glutinosa TaxID=99300 RepID=A0ABR0XGL8_REHGL
MDAQDVKSNLVLILDFGSQYTHLITRRIRALNVFSLCINGTSPLKSITDLNPSVIILSGGPHSVHAPNAPCFPPGFIDYVESNGIHVLGICYGLQLIVQQMGGVVRVGEKQEYGRMEIEVGIAEGLFGNKKVGDRQNVWMSHGDEAVKLPEGFEVVARSKQGAVAAVQNQRKRFYGLQYHPEVTHSQPEGMETLKYFLFDLCGITAGWTMEDVLDEELKVIKSTVAPEDHVICALSGGVDSTVAATLVHKAIGDRLHCVAREERVLETFEKDLHLPVTCIDAVDQFLSKLKGVRELGKIMGVPQGFLKRHPFPGPGLAVRVPGDVTLENRLDILRKADEIFIQSIKDAGIYDSIWQAFAVFMPVLTVGVQGDQRTHSYAITLRAVTSQDGMTADWYYFDHKFLVDLSTRICNEVPGVNRVLLDITSKPPSTIEWE